MGKKFKRGKHYAVGKVKVFTLIKVAALLESNELCSLHYERKNLISSKKYDRLFIYDKANYDFYEQIK